MNKLSEEVRALILAELDKDPSATSRTLMAKLRDVGHTVGLWQIAGVKAGHSRQGPDKIKPKPGFVGTADVKPKKRDIDTTEDKATIPKEVLEQPGRVLIMEGTPDTESRALIDVGFAPNQIIIAENNPVVFAELQRHYLARLQLVHLDVYEVPKDLSQRYAYIHLDPCGHYTFHLADCIDAAVDRLTPWARIRVSAGTTRSQPHSFHARMHTAMLALVRAGMDADEEANRWRWERIDLTLRQMKSEAGNGSIVIAQLIARNIFMKAYFGMGLQEWGKVSAINPGFPVRRGRHKVQYLNWWRYKDAATHKHEYARGDVFTTVWVDLAPVTSKNPFTVTLDFFDDIWQGPSIYRFNKEGSK